MYQTIYVPLDNSPHTQGAALTALALATELKGRLVAAHVPPAIWSAERRRRLSAGLGAPVAGGAGAQGTDATPFASLTRQAGALNVPHDTRLLAGHPLAALAEDIAAAQAELLVVAAGDSAEPDPLVLKLVRRRHVDTLVVRDANADGHIVACIDGSPQSFAGLKAALTLGKLLNKSVEAVGVYDPYLHYTLFNGIVNVLSEQASQIFKFADQEKLHEEIIDTGLAKIYQAHLEVAGRVAQEEGVALKLTLLDGKGPQKILQHARKSRPYLMVLGRIGVHSKDDMDIGATAENLLRTAPCSLLVVSRKYQPSIDVQAAAAVEWLPDAKKMMERVPDFVRGVATTAILRWAMERGHSVITSGLIKQAMADLMPAHAAQAMGYVAEELAISRDNLNEGTTFICPTCGHAVRNLRPVACTVCKTDGAQFEAINRQALESLGKLKPGALTVEETFDGTKLQWTAGAKEVLRRVPSGYERRRLKARIEKTAKVRGITTLSKEFAVDMVEQELAQGSYLSARGERLQIEVKDEERPDDTTPRARDKSPLPWTDAAWKRICRVPEGFMRDMTRERVETFASARAATSVSLALCEEGIAEGRRMMAEMLGNYKRPTPAG